MAEPSADAPQILVVDDDTTNRNLLAELLRRHGFACTVAEDAAAARGQLLAGGFELVLCDVNMPGESGIELARHIVAEGEDTAVIMVTGADEPALAEAATDLGVYGYVLKPYRPNELMIVIANALRRRVLERESRARRESLEDEVRARTAELRLAQEETIWRLAGALDRRDSVTGTHVARMSRWCELLALRAGLGPLRAEAIRVASLLHDVGKIAIPDAILRRPGPLDDEERLLMQSHTTIGAELLGGSRSPLLDLAATIAATHHERWDGTGYPNGLAGEEIPVEGRIAAIADVYDALTSDRPYRRAFTAAAARGLLRSGQGSQFDPHLLDLFLDCSGEPTPRFVATGSGANSPRRCRHPAAF